MESSTESSMENRNEFQNAAIVGEKKSEENKKSGKKIKSEQIRYENADDIYK